MKVETIRLVEPTQRAINEANEKGFAFKEVLVKYDGDTRAIEVLYMERQIDTPDVERETTNYTEAILYAEKHGKRATSEWHDDVVNKIKSQQDALDELNRH